MRSVVEACTVRPDILHKSFNPEIFTLNLSEVVNAYRGKVVSAHALYTDAESFFRDATYPTEGLRMVLGDVFGRLAGDVSRPAIQRLETAFGGGKTHILIAMAHLAFRGRDLEPVVRDLLPETPLPAPGEIPTCLGSPHPIPHRGGLDHHRFFSRGIGSGGIVTSKGQCLCRQFHFSFLPQAPCD